MLRDKRHVVMLSNSVISCDPRVRKWANTLHSAGWKVTTIGVKDNTSSSVENSLPWTHIDVPANTDRHNSQTSIMEKILTRIGRDGGLLRRIIYYFGLRYGIRIYSRAFLWCLKDSHPIYSAMKQMAQRHIVDVDLWIANDWDMLPIVSELRKEKGGALLYDSHEFASEQFMQNEHWRQWRQPLVKAIEKKYIIQANHITTVSEGLCHSLAETYQLHTHPSCIRNIPEFVSVPLTESTSPVKVLYQGVIMPGRGLEELIKSIAYWRFDGTLIIRGPHHDDAYLEQLTQLAENGAGQSPVIFEPPVPPSKMIEKAASADIGVMFLGAESKHNHYALPNKLFEYIMAGLCVCVSKSPNMAEIVTKFKLGKVIGSLRPEDIAEGLNTINLSDLKLYKAASRIAAKELNWGLEKKTLLNICNALAPDGI